MIELYLLVFHIFAFQGLQNLVPWVPPLHFVLVCKMHIYIPKMTLLNLLIWISFFYIKFANFWYITCSVPYLIPIWNLDSIPWTNLKGGICKIKQYLNYILMIINENILAILRTFLNMQKNFFEKLYTKQTSTTATTQCLYKTPDQNKISN